VKSILRPQSCSFLPQLKESSRILGLDGLYSVRPHGDLSFLALEIMYFTCAWSSRVTKSSSDGARSDMWTSISCFATQRRARESPCGTTHVVRL
jgi:hypothetical protein